VATVDRGLIAARYIRRQAGRHVLVFARRPAPKKWLRRDVACQRQASLAVVTWVILLLRQVGFFFIVIHNKDAPIRVAASSIRHFAAIFGHNMRI